MTLRPAFSLSLLFALAACTQSEAPAPAAAPEATAPAAAQAPSAAPSEASGASAPAAEAATEPTPAATPEVPVGPTPVAGVDFVEIAGGQPFEPGTGKIEVVEVFSYTCPHCASFEPMLVSWRGKQTADVKFTPVAGYFAANPQPFAKAFYAAEAMGVLGKTHEAMYRAIHLDRSLPLNADEEKIAAFYGRFGVDAGQFASTMRSFAVDAKLKRALQFIQRSGVDASPTVLVEGKYRVTGKTLEDTLRITTHLVAKERAARGG